MVYQGVDAATFARRDATANQRCLDRLRLQPGFLLNVGNDYPHKNVRLLLAAYARFREARAGPRDLPDLVLFGPATGVPGGLYHLPEDAWVSAGVRYLGTVSDDDATALFQEAGAFVYPTAYEGFGLPVLEAMPDGPRVPQDARSTPARALGGGRCVAGRLT